MCRPPHGWSAASWSSPGPPDRHPGLPRDSPPSLIRASSAAVAVERVGAGELAPRSTSPSELPFSVSSPGPPSTSTVVSGANPSPTVHRVRAVSPVDEHVAQRPVGRAHVSPPQRWPVERPPPPRPRPERRSGRSPRRCRSRSGRGRPAPCRVKDVREGPRRLLDLRRRSPPLVPRRIRCSRRLPRPASTPAPGRPWISSEKAEPTTNWISLSGSASVLGCHRPGPGRCRGGTSRSSADRVRSTRTPSTPGAGPGGVAVAKLACLRPPPPS